MHVNGHPTVLIILTLFPVCIINGELDSGVNPSNDINSHESGGSKITAEDKAGRLTIEQLYEEAYLAYLGEEWEQCVDLFKKTRQRYGEYKKAVVHCRRECKEEANKMKSMFTRYVGEMAFYEKKIKETLCLLQCTREYEKLHGEGSLTVMPPKLQIKFSEFQDYAFAHICYYQINRYKDAANALFTYLIRHPEDKMAQKYMNHYFTNPDVSKDSALEDLEAPPYIEMYNDAKKVYEEENYSTAIQLFEHSLKLYLNAHDECRSYCEGPFDQGWHPELTVEIANHYTYALQCKQNCTKWSNTIRGEYYSDALANHYHYLQFAYYKVGNLYDACHAVASYLLFYPADETMLNNKKYYTSMPKFKEEYFTPRQEAMIYIKQQTSEFALLQFISEEFKAQSDNNESKDDLKSDNIRKILFSTSELLQPLKLKDGESFINHGHTMDHYERNVRITAAENDLQGKMRYVADGFLNDWECDLLINMTKIAAIAGDGYASNKSPHSRYERFEGATIGRLATLVYLGILDPEPVNLLLKVTEKIKIHVEKYFNISDPLYFTFTHLTRRSSLPDSPEFRQDLSHRIHADNCIMSKGYCHRKSPAYVWRDYSAILYLNHGFIGGEFIFTSDHSAKTVEAIVQPRCGRAVAFTADERNLHGVRAISRGSRFALALWFTQQHKYLEVERILARAVLQRVENYGAVKRNGTAKVPTAYEEVLINFFRNDTILQEFLQD